MRLALASALCFAAPAMATELPVRAVTLSNAGLALVEHAGALAPDEPITLRVPVESVDDVLKSLLLRDAAAADAAWEAWRRKVAEVLALSG